MRTIAGFLFSILLLQAGALPVQAIPSVHPLHSYVNTPDPAFQIKSTELISYENGVRTFEVHFDSLNWRQSHEVDRTLWSHVLKVSIPDQLKSHSSLYVINGGSNSNFLEIGPRRLFGGVGTRGLSDEMAAETGTVVSELMMIPNQALTFHGDGVPRKEDDLIAYSWARFFETGDRLWVAQFPMTKAAVAGLNVVEQVVREQAGVDVDGFVVAGGSKRGWTSWLVAATDPRVKGVIPIVIDLVNMIPSMKHHHASYGFWADAVHDYEDQGIFDNIDTPQMTALARLIDPIYFLDELEMPKFILNAANDQFFLPDSSQFYLDQLKGPTWLRYVPNSGHLINDFDAFNSMLIFYDAVIMNTDLPDLTWNRSRDWEMDFQIRGAADRITLWEIVGPNDRDFRMMPGPDRKKYEPVDIPVNSHGQYHVSVTPPSGGEWKGWFVEVQFESGQLGYMKLTTDVRVAQ